MNIKPYITSFRLRTLPLSVAGVVLGAALRSGEMRWWVFLFTVVTTLCLQILTNLANELGDALKGTDAEQSGRQQYSLQSGAITINQMKNCIWLFVVLSLVFGGILIGLTFGTLFCTQSYVFMALGVLAIVAAVKYTLGKHPYGYHGLGDLGVFLFFGLLGVLGSYYMQSQNLTWRVFVAAVAIALPIVAVLNLNNIRDMAGDLVHHKVTLASKLGPKWARLYQSVLVLLPFVLFPMIGCWWPMFFLPVFAYHVYFVWTHGGSALDAHMKVLSLSTLAMAIMQFVVSLL